ncbi:PDZ domain-containing protein [Paenibacillus sp. 1011MAR3C5]|uniref:trypsin-like peptidase domain-containing protein n=1 Tax=Paenibacillus sp. 1011MAR3C5 TaxID=1675787 RepID=UPI000E6CCD93|nr:trypsin-like peptidase domain-containing protein [Paenibacillus sp. 1011MAR3C5]RJE89001.1 PDZ domain-containing protein [Paenibacillus sp. 1011MAR3C5]
MDDQNKKNGYDDFFNPEESKRSDDTNESKEGAAEPASVQEPKPSYYYSYGPSVNDPSQPVASGNGYERTDGYDRGAQQSPVSYPPQLRPVPPAGGNVKNAFQVREKKKGPTFKSMFLSFMAGVLVVGGLMYAADTRNWFTSGNTVATQSEGSGSGTGTTASGSGAGSGANVVARPDNIAQLFEQASPAVVKIETYAKVRTNNGGNSLFNDPFFRQFFGDNYPGTQAPSEEQNGDMQQSGIGTGFFFEADGHILTNQHVVGQADEIRVTVQGYDKPFTAKLLGSSYDLDLAVLKIEGEKEFPTLPLGSSDDINIGDWVVAIGNPYGFDHTITAGVLSAKERPIDIPDQQGERNYKHLLQTDASINPGNSGGPLLNVKGEVIGINTAVSSQAQGIGFAIPTSTITEVLESLKNNTEVPKEAVPFIGAELYDMTDEFAKQLGLDKAEGSLVKSVYYNSPAYLAGLTQFDVIVGVEGKKMTTSAALIADIQSRKVGEQVEFNILRQGKEMNLTVEIGDKNVFGLQ